MRHGWWRRNLWGLILLLPVTAGLFAFNADLLYDVNILAKPRDPVPVDATGTAVLDNFEVTLESFESVSEDDPAFLDRDITVPESVQAWRAVVRFSGPEDDLSLCKVALVDEGDRAYPSGPVMLPLGPFGCSPDDYESPSPFTTTFYFLLPAQARPQALQITWLPLLPRYVQLPVDG
jgi:hypothetical protein